MAATLVFREGRVLFVVGKFAQAAKDDDGAFQASGGIEGADGDFVLMLDGQGVEFQHGQGGSLKPAQYFIPLPAAGAKDENVSRGCAADDELLCLPYDSGDFLLRRGDVYLRGFRAVAKDAWLGFLEPRRFVVVQYVFVIPVRREAENLARVPVRALEHDGAAFDFQPGLAPRLTATEEALRGIGAEEQLSTRTHGLTDEPEPRAGEKLRFINEDERYETRRLRCRSCAGNGFRDQCRDALL